MIYNYLYNSTMKKPVEFLGDSLDALKQFPQEIRREAGFQLDRVQQGLEPDDWKPMKTVGKGVREIRLRDSTGAFRVIYVASFDEAIYVLHCFQKQSEQTPKPDIDLAKDRLKQIQRRLR